MIARLPPSYGRSPHRMGVEADRFAEVAAVAAVEAMRELRPLALTPPQRCSPPPSKRSTALRRRKIPRSGAGSLRCSN